MIHVLIGWNTCSCLVPYIHLCPVGTDSSHRLTVAMMSRITLHLKKQGRLHEIIDWDSGGVYTFRGITSTIHNTRLHFARSGPTDAPGRGVDSTSSQHRPTQVTVTIDELITREDYLDVSDDAATREVSVHDLDDTKKDNEWHEMSVRSGTKGTLV